MSIKTKWLLLMVLAIGAFSCYWFGFSTGVVTLVVAGLGLEIVFWLGLFKGFRRTRL